MELRPIPDLLSKAYVQGDFVIIIGLYSHPSKSGHMRMVHKTQLDKGWSMRQWRLAIGLEIDLFFMGVKRLPKIINI